MWDQGRESVQSNKAGKYSPKHLQFQTLCGPPLALWLSVGSLQVNGGVADKVLLHYPHIFLQSFYLVCVISVHVTNCLPLGLDLALAILIFFHHFQN